MISDPGGFVNVPENMQLRFNLLKLFPEVAAADISAVKRLITNFGGRAMRD